MQCSTVQCSAVQFSAVQCSDCRCSTQPWHCGESGTPALGQPVLPMYYHANAILPMSLLPMQYCSHLNFRNQFPSVLPDTKMHFIEEEENSQTSKKNVCPWTYQHQTAEYAPINYIFRAWVCAKNYYNKYQKFFP